MSLFYRISVHIVGRHTFRAFVRMADQVIKF